MIDIHAHYVPPDGQKVAVEVGQRHNLKLERNEHNRDLGASDGKSFLGPIKAEFLDLDPRTTIMDPQAVSMQTLSKVGSYSFDWMAPQETMEFTRWLNEAFAQAVKNYPQRFVALASAAK